MIERVFNFGTNNELSGILTLPDIIPQMSKNLPSIIFLNAGLLHKTGFSRFNTDCARHLSLIGYPSLRFDLHNLGDSASCYISQYYNDQVIKDIKEAIDYIANKIGSEKCILIGLCSGADYAHIIATMDQRISGLVLLDGYGYRTLGFYIRDYGPGLLHPFRAVRFIVNKLIKRFLLLKGNFQTSSKNNVIYLRTFPRKKQVIKDLNSFIERGINLFFIYSGGIPLYYNYANQFFDMFRSLDFKGKVSHRYIEEADHTYTIIKIREKLSSIITEWIIKNYPLNISEPKNELRKSPTST